MQPTAIIDGLAVYKAGKGVPVFLMPYPHAYTDSPMIEGSLANILVDSGRSVITFDAPGSYYSTRKPRVNLQEMLECTRVTLQYFNISSPAHFMGHSMGSLCSIAWIVENLSTVKSLVLIGAISDYKEVMKYSIHKHFKWWQKEYWQVILQGLLTWANLASMATYKKLRNTITYASFYHKELAPLLEVEKGDSKKIQPIRMKWSWHARKIHYNNKLNKITCPVLICVGRHDPQTPVEMNKEIHEKLNNSRLVIFEESGHSPFEEEREKFIKVIENFTKA